MRSVVPTAKQTVNHLPSLRRQDGAMLQLSPTAREDARLAALHALELLDTPPETEFDAIVAGVQHLFGCKIAYVALVDANRQWLRQAAGSMHPRQLATGHSAQEQSRTTTSLLFQIPTATSGMRDCRWFSGRLSFASTLACR